MAVGLDQDSEYLRRTGIASGGAGTLSDGGFANTAQGIWLFRPAGTTTYALTAAGSIIHCQAGAREVVLGFNSAGAALADLNLQIIFNSGGGAGTPATFAGHAGNTFLDEWVFYFIYEAGGTQHAGYIRLAAPSTVVKLSRANDNAGSQYVNDLTFGNESGGGAVAMGHYAYGRARYASGLTDADMIAWAAATAPLAGDWGAWALPNASTLTDGTGNGRTLTGSSGLSSETDPTLGGGSTTADSSLRDASETIAAAATVAVAAASALRDRTEALSGAMSSPVAAAASLIDQSDRLASTAGAPQTSVAGALGDGDMQLQAAAALPVAAAGALRDQADQLAASTSIPVAATAAMIDGQDSVSAAVLLAIGAAAAMGDGAQLLTSSGAVAVSITGTLRDLQELMAILAGGPTAIGELSLRDQQEGVAGAVAVAVSMTGTLADQVERISAIGANATSITSSIVDTPDGALSAVVLAVSGSAVLLDADLQLVAEAALAVAADALLVDSSDLLRAGSVLVVVEMAAGYVAELIVAERSFRLVLDKRSFNLSVDARKAVVKT